MTAPVRRRLGDRGFTTLQLAILFPVLLWWLMLVVQWGLWWHAKQVADAAAAEAVDVARMPTGTTDDAARAVHTYLSQVGNLRNVRVDVDRRPDLVTAEVRGDAVQLIPWRGWGVTAQAEGVRERVLPESQR